MSRDICVNNRRYALREQPLVVVCIDGCEPAYLDAAIDAGCTPWLAERRNSDTWRIADCVIPSFTNPNNLSIVTGAPPAVHGICGNTLLDVASGRETLMNDPEWLTAPTLFPAFQAAGQRVAIVTAKDKLRRLLGHGLAADNAVCFSAEKADVADLSEAGIDNLLTFVGLPLPSVYSAALTEFVFAAGVRLLQAWRPDVMYLSTTDYIQHKHAPGSPAANALYARIDAALMQLHEAGAIIVITTDHGMKPKHDAAGQPNVLYLQDALDAAYGTQHTQVILPITDPYVAHHGALGSFATVYVKDGVDPQSVRQHIGTLAGVAEVWSRTEATERFELPVARIGDVVVIAESSMTLGSARSRHDLSGLDAPLRSHGGLSEQQVPLVCNRRCATLPDGRALRNFDAFDVACNFAEASA